MERKQFTFYQSFAKAADRIRDPKERCAFYDAVKDYALYGTEPDETQLPDVVAIAFALARPNLDASRQKAESGRLGGSKHKKAEPKQTESKRKTENEHEMENKIEIEKKKENESETETEDDCLSGDAPQVAAAAVAVEEETLFLQGLPKQLLLSQTARAELHTYLQELGADVCRRAVDTAMDANKLQWSYIRGILRSKQTAGVRSLADWDAQEARRTAGASSQNGKSDNSCMREYIQALQEEDEEEEEVYGWYK